MNISLEDLLVEPRFSPLLLASLTVLLTAPAFGGADAQQ
jgi:hypothetical protein